MQLENVKAIVSGAASGLGRCFALELIRAGAAVAAGDIDVNGLARLKAECENLPGRLLTLKLDISQENSVATFIAEVVKEFDGVNLLVNNAGILRDGLLAKEETGWVKKLPTAQWKQVLDVNLTGHYLMAREVAAEILKRGVKESVIVNISSISNAGNPGQSNYAASKAGLDACTRTWALELAPHGIRVAGIAPGVIETPILNNISDAAKEDLLEGIPLQRFGVPYEIWQALRFIVECEYFTGRIVYVDGGSNF
ncbi:MAG TPA: SDR family oxidoreductase [Pyrinomonadaceae bacterium]